MRVSAQAKGATGTEIAVLMALADFRNGNGAAWPSLPTLVQHTGFADKTVRRALARLRELGLLHVVIPATPRTSTRYRVVQPSLRSEQTGQSDQSDRSELPVKFQKKITEEIKQRAHAKSPALGACTLDPQARLAVRAPRSGTRTERSAANKAAWAVRASPGPTKVRAAPEPYRPYQLPLPSGPLLRDLPEATRAELFREARLAAFGKS